MHTLNRFLVGIALLVWLAIPAIGNGGGGENAGGTGVWILPRAMPLCAGVGTAEIRETKLVTSLIQDLVMSVSAECGAAAATFVDEMSAVPTALPVSGSLVCIPRNLLQAMVTAGSPRATIVVADANQIGYVIELTLVPATGAISITVR
jgi:hypothetical protein